MSYGITKLHIVIIFCRTYRHHFSFPASETTLPFSVTPYCLFPSLYPVISFLLETVGDGCVMKLVETVD